jgi:hypothetical protein
MSDELCVLRLTSCVLRVAFLCSLVRLFVCSFVRLFSVLGSWFSILGSRFSVLL